MPQTGPGYVDSPLISNRTWYFLFAIWICFLLRAMFYAAVFPVWEGFDEWSHFAVVGRMALRGEPLVFRQSPLPRDVDASLTLAPIPWELRNFAPPAVTYDVYWRLPLDERVRRRTEFLTLPPAWARQDGTSGLSAYEALQPPLYYWIAAPLAWATAGLDLGSRILWLRALSVVIASSVIPLCFGIGRVVFGADALALACAALAASMPEFAIDVARAGNECLAVPLFTIVIWLVSKSAVSGLGGRRALCLGAALGLGLLTKAYFVTAIPPVLVLLGYELWRTRGRPRPWVAPSMVVISSSAIALWWYVRNVLSTGTASGLSEAAMLRGKLTETDLLRLIPDVHWPAAIDGILLSHFWFGGWSSLTVRSWIYHVFYAVMALAAIGLVRIARDPAILALLLVYGAFWAGQCYNVLLLFASKGMAVSMGWYLYAVVAAEVALCVAGLRAISPLSCRRYVPLACVLSFMLLDLYTMHVIAIPYYAGLIVHRSNGALAAFHLADLGHLSATDVLTRLTAFKTGILSVTTLALSWAGYIAATFGLAGIAAACSAQTGTDAAARPSR